MTDIFISYASDDRVEAAKLAGFLEDQGYSVWWDRELIAGQDFHATIDRVLEDCNAAIVIWSDSSIKSRWVLGEAETAANAEKLIPVRVNTLAPAKVPIAFRALHTAILSDHLDLLNAIRRRFDIPRKPKGVWEIVAARAIRRLKLLRRRFTLGRAAIALVLIVVMIYFGLDTLNWIRIHDSMEIGDFKQHIQRFPIDIFYADARAKLAGATEWPAIESSKNPAELRSYIERYPDSVYTEFARLRLGRLEAIAARRYKALIADSAIRMLPSKELDSLSCDELWTAMRFSTLWAIVS